MKILIDSEFLSNTCTLKYELDDLVVWFYQVPGEEGGGWWIIWPDGTTYHTYASPNKLYLDSPTIDRRYYD